MNRWGKATSRGRPLGGPLAFLAVAASIVVPSASAVAAPAADPTVESVACAHPPAGAPAAGERDRFISLWQPRIADKKFLRSWFEHDAVPPSIRAEGFHGFDQAATAWLTDCLVDTVIARSGVDDQPAGKQPTAERRTEINALTSMFIFQKESLAGLRKQIEAPTTVPAEPVKQLGIEDRIDRHPAPAVVKVVAAKNVPVAPVAVPVKPAAAQLAIDADVTVDLGELIDQLLVDIGNVTSRLLASPPLDVIGGLTYRVCAESAGKPLSCTIPLPIGIPTPVAVGGGLVPNLLMNLTPQLDLLHPGDFTAKVSATRLFPNAGPLPAHVFAVYDPPFTNRRLAYGFDGRSSTLAASATTSVTLHNIAAAVAGDVRLSYAVTHSSPGSTEALTFAVKRLNDNGLLRPKVEADPTVGALAFSPVPSSVTGTVRLKHNGANDEDAFTMATTTQSHVDALFRQETTTTTPRVRRQVTASIDKLPSSLSVNLKHEGAVEKIAYRASGPIERLAVSAVTTPDITKPAVSDQASVVLNGLPAEIDAVVNTTTNSLQWNASAPTARGEAQVHLVSGVPRPYDVNATVTGIPASWRGGYADGRASFEGISGPIGTLALNLTNHGQVVALPGDHLNVNNDTTTGDLDASIQASAVTKASFARNAAAAGGFEADLNLGNQGDFAIGVHLLLGGNRLDITGTVQKLPSALHLAVSGGRVVYAGDGHPTLQFTAGFGTPAGLAATQDPAQVHGLSVRDGVDAVKANLFLTGAPTGFDFDTAAGIYGVKGFAPEVDPLTLDVDLRHLVGTPLRLVATQIVGTGDPADFTLGPVGATRAADNTATTSLHYAASRAMGALNLEAVFGGDVATFTAGSVPSSIDASMVIGPVDRRVTVNTGSRFGSLDATYRRTGDSEFAARVGLTNLPTSMTLALGKSSGQSGSTQATLPTFSYIANAPGLTGVASVRAALFGAPASANVEWTNLGSKVTGEVEDTTLKISSTPATTSFQLDAAAFVGVERDLTFNAGPLEHEGSIAARIDITDLHLRVTDIANLKVIAGISTAIVGGAGDYGEFEFSEASDTHLDLHSHLDIDFGIGTIEDAHTIDFDNKDIGNAIVSFRLATNDLGRWQHISTPVPCPFNPFDDVDVDLDLRPNPQSTTDGPSLTVTGATAKGSPAAWIATPIVVDFLDDPTEPLYGPFVADIIARFASPLGGDQAFSLSC